jgi:hypothetical protein
VANTEVAREPINIVVEIILPLEKTTIKSIDGISRAGH